MSFIDFLKLCVTIYATQFDIQHSEICSQLYIFVYLMIFTMCDEYFPSSITTMIFVTKRHCAFCETEHGFL